MKLRTLVILVSVLQAVHDVVGIVVTLWFNNIFGTLPTHQDRREIEEIDLDGRLIVISDFSLLRSVNLVYYTLPYLFSGVIPRMLNGFKCVTADQKVIDKLENWKEAVEQAREDGKDDLSTMVDAHTTWLVSVLNTSISELQDALQERRVSCSDLSFQSVHVSPHSTSLSKLTWEERMKHVTKEEENLSSSHTMFLVQVSTMGLNSLSSLLVTVLAVAENTLVLLHAPWLLLTALEIAGNVCVMVAFLIVPGLCQLTSLVCLVRVIWLRWVWVNAVRRHMNIPPPPPPPESVDHEFIERALLRSLLNNKGKIRLL